MVAEGVTHARFDIGRVVSRIFTVFGENPVTFSGLTLLLSLPSLLVAYWNTRYFGSAGALRQPGMPPGQILFMAVGVMLGALVYIVFTYLLQAALIYGSISALNGRKASFMECLATGAGQILALIGISILSGLGMMLGFILLIVPGIIVAIMWSVVVPVRIAEHLSITAAFRRSTELTRGYRWSIFALFVMFTVLYFVLTLAVRPLMGMPVFVTAGVHLSIGYFFATAISTLVFGLTGAIGVASVYYELRMVKEGIAPEQLAAIFS